jgi:energy-coupling factor transport system ATP-binding protein
MILLQRICFSYPEKTEPVFTSLSLSVDSCSWLVVMGPDGSGKTTLGKLMKGLLEPDSGLVRLEARPEGPRLDVGYLGGDPYDYLVGTSVEEDVVFGMENLGIARTQMKPRLEQALQCTGLTGMEQRLTHTLSGGEQQNLALAATLAMGARVLILDEALSMLDRPTRRAIRSLIESLRVNHGLTVVEMTHDLEEALTGDRLIFLSGGTLTYDGSPTAFMSTPLGSQWARVAGGMPGLQGELAQRGLWGPDGLFTACTCADLVSQLRSVPHK